MWALVAVVLLHEPPLGDVPPALACLQRHYIGRAERREDLWHLILPDGSSIPYDDGRAKTLEQKLADPDVEDAFSMRYHPGPIVPVTQPDDDPGRVRLEALFRAVYAPSGSPDLVDVDVLGQRVRVHRRAEGAFRAVARRLEPVAAADPSWRPFLTGLSTFARRPIAGTDRASAHSWGIALDLNPQQCQYWRWDGGAGGVPPPWHNRVPQAIVDAFEVEGFIWGGRWRHYDTMHFEWRPELLDPSCTPTAAKTGEELNR